MFEQSEPLALPLAEAAARLGLSPDAVRMRVKRGQLNGVRRAGRLYVQLPAEQVERTGSNTAEQANEPVRTDRTEALIAELHAEVAYLRAALEREQTGAAELRRLLAMSTPALPAPQDAATGSETVENAPAGVEPLLRPVRRRWRFWRR